MTSVVPPDVSGSGCRVACRTPPGAPAAAVCGSLSSCYGTVASEEGLSELGLSDSEESLDSGGPSDLDAEMFEAEDEDEISESYSEGGEEDLYLDDGAEEDDGSALASAPAALSLDEAGRQGRLATDVAQVAEVRPAGGAGGGAFYSFFFEGL